MTIQQALNKIVDEGIPVSVGLDAASTRLLVGTLVLIVVIIILLIILIQSLMKSMNKT